MGNNKYMENEEAIHCIYCKSKNVNIHDILNTGEYIEYKCLDCGTRWSFTSRLNRDCR